jgi:hypothetical protein
MTQQHSITPPPELVDEWRRVPEYTDGLRKLTMVTITVDRLQYIATQAARWGADQELDACCEWLDKGFGDVGNFPATLRAARRPKPPSLKEQALAELVDAYDEDKIDDSTYDTIRRALEALPE